MYLSKDIDQRFTQHRNKFKGFVSYRAIATRLRNTFKGIDNLKFKVVKFEDLDVNEFSVGGLYDQTTNTKYVILNLSKYSEEMLFDSHLWKDFYFLISQTIQHETIHQDQFKHREDCDEEADIDFKFAPQDTVEDRYYLADNDEIDAYAHDIAMEIKHFYPLSNPYEVLKSINSKRKLPSFSYYKNTFKGCEWSDVKKRLLLKTYKWIPHV